MSYQRNNQNKKRVSHDIESLATKNRASKSAQRLRQKGSRANSSTRTAESFSKKEQLAAQKASKKATARRVAEEMARRNETTTQRKKAPDPSLQKNSAGTGMGANAKKKNLTKASSNTTRPRNVSQTQTKSASTTNKRRNTSGRQNPTSKKPSSTQKQSAPKQKRMTQKMLCRRKQLRQVVAVLIVLFVVCVGVYCSINLLFRVKYIQVQSFAEETPVDTGVYTQEEILRVLDIPMEEQFLNFSTREKTKTLENAFPLLEQVEVVRDYPDTILVRVTPAIATYTMRVASGWLVLSEQLHVMSTVTEQPDLLQLIGETPNVSQVGQLLSFVVPEDEILSELIAENEARSEGDTPQPTFSPQEIQVKLEEKKKEKNDAMVMALVDLLANIEAQGLLSEITAIEFAGTEGITFLYQDRVGVLIGTTNSLEYKLDIVQYILENEKGDGIAQTDTGWLDVSYQNSEGTISTNFAQSALVYPLGQNQINE